MGDLLEPDTRGVLDPLLEQFLDLYPPAQRDALRASWPNLLLKLDRLAGEILDVEAQGLPYAHAVRDDAMGYPMMTRIHYGVSAVIQYELTPEMYDLVRSTLSRAESSEHIDDLRRAVFANAAAAGATKLGALLRFLLYEALLLNLLLACWDNPEVEASGTSIDFEWRAQQILNGWLALPEARCDDVRPLHGMLAEGMVWVCERVKQRIHEADGDQVRAIIDELIPAVVCTRSLGARDAVLLRNSIAGRLRDETFKSQQLVDRYPDLYRTPAAVDTRRHRLKLGNVRPNRRFVDELLRAPVESDDGRSK